MFDINDYGLTVKQLYYEIVNDLGENNLIIGIDDTMTNGGKFYKLPNGNYSIKIASNSQNDFVLSHELLHVCIGVNQTIPTMVHFDNSKDNVCEPLGILFNSLLEHKYIFTKQKSLGIDGYNDYINESYNKIIEARQFISDDINENFMIIIRLITFINDLTPSCLDKPISNYCKTIEESMPQMYEIAYNFLKIHMNKDKETPYYLRKAIVQFIDNFISLFEFNMSFIKYDINVMLSVRENQLYMPANTVLDLLLCEEKSYFATKFDKQSICNIKWTFPLSEVSKRRDSLENIKLGELLEMYHIEYYIDDRKGAWYLKQ